MALINRYSVNEKGAIVITGNALGLSRMDNTTNPGFNHAINQFITTSTTLPTPSAWVGIANTITAENNITFDWRLNSSSANLVMPSSSEVLYAELIWGGMSKSQSGGGNVVDVSAFIDNPIILTDPNGNSVQITPSTVTASLGTVSNNNIFYTRSQDITTIVQNGGIGRYTVGSVPSAININEGNTVNHAGWSMIVAYKNTNLTPKNMNIYAGGNLITTNGTVNVPISGFLTPPSGPIEARLSLSAQEGDAALTGDQMFFGPSANNLFQLSGPNNPPNNFFGSQINIGDPNNADVGQLDITGTFGTRNANAFTGQNVLAGRQGWDITNIDCSSTMNNNQSNALIRITTNQDVYAINGIGLTIETILIEGIKSVNNPVVDVGDSLVYTVTLTNQGGVTTSNVVFKDTTPNGTTYVGPLTVSTNYSGVNVQDGITISTIAPGEDVTIQWTVLVNTIPNPNPILNVGRILVTSLPETQTNTVSTRVNTADLSIVKSATPSPGIPGDTLSYSLVVTNNGPDTSYLVRVIDTIPNNIIAESARYSTDNGTTWLPWLGFYDTASLAQNQVVTISLQGIIQPFATDSIVNTAVVSSSITADPVTINNISTVTTPLLQSADLSVVKTFNPSIVTAGQTLTYILSVENNGPSAATNVTISDAIVDSLENVVYSIDGGLSFAPWDGSLNLGTLANGASEDVIIRGLVKTSIVNAIPNTVSVTSSVFDPVTINNVSSVITPVTQIADVAIIKTLENTTSISVGDTITFRNFIKNNGPSDAVGVVLLDNIPTDISNPEFSIDEGATYNPWVSPYEIGTLAYQDSISILIRGIMGNNTSVTNYATVAALTFDPNLLNNYSNASTDIGQVANLSISKSATPNPAIAGNTLSYTIVVCNTGPSDAADVEVQDIIISSRLENPMVSVDGGPYTVFTGEVGIGTVNIDTCKTLSIQGVVNSLDSGSITNTVTVASTTPEENPDDNYATTVVQIENSADISVVKTQIEPIDIYAGGVVRYSIVVSNNGPSNAEDIVLYDILSSDIISASISSDGGANYSQWLGSYTVGDLAVGNSQTFIIRADITSSALNDIVNTATVVSTTPDPSIPNNISTVTSPLTNIADVYVIKLENQVPQVVGDTVIYSIIVGNNGPSDSQNVILYDTLVDYITTPNYSIDGGTTWNDWNSNLNLGTISALTAKGVIIRGILASIPSDGNLDNVAMAYGTTFDSNLANNVDAVTSFIVNTADVSISKFALPEPVIAGETLTYSIIVKNNGPSAAQNISISDVLVSNILNPEYAVNNSGVYNPWISPYTIPQLNVNETLTLSIRGIVSEDTTGTIPNTARVSSSTPDPIPENNISTTISTVVGSADLEIIKTQLTPVSIFAGSLVEYNISIRNNGPSTAQNVLVTDILPSYIVSASLSVNNGVSYIPWTGVYTISALRSQETRTARLRAEISSIAVGDLVNTVTISSTTPDPIPENNVSTVTIPITPTTPEADVEITKTSSPNPVSIGGQLTYTLTIVNNGPETAENVVVYDTNNYSLSNLQYSLDNGLTWNIWTGSYNIGTMLSGQTVVILIRGIVYDCNSQFIKNVATVSLSTFDPNLDNNIAIEYTRLKTKTDLSICQIWCQNSVVVSNMAQFVLRVSNHGPHNASNIVINNDVSRFLSNPEYSIDGGVTWNIYTGSINISDLYDCDSIDILIRGTVIFTGNNYIRNVATVSSDNEDCNIRNNTSEKIIKLISYYR